MPLLSGPILDKLKEELTEWYATRRQQLIAAMEEDHPYGTIKISVDEQYQNFMDSTPDDLASMVAQLRNKYRGLPNASQLVSRDMATYFRSMMRQRQKLEEGAVNAE